jgi:hypothetical protein
LLLTICLGEERAQQSLHADAASLAEAAERQKGECDQEGAGKRQQRHMRSRIEERFAQLAEKIRNARREIQARPHTFRENMTISPHW